jgi:hypothetical protein
MCPGFPGARLLGCGHATGSIVLMRSSYSTGVSIPSEECRRQQEHVSPAGLGGGDTAHPAQTSG